MRPDFIYGTAWKEDLTEVSVLAALKAGFRAIDTANQRKHYFEQGVGAALSKAYAQLGIRREDLFLQTKFTSPGGQDHRKPYDDSDPIEVQVVKSMDSSLRHLGTDYVDSYLLHGPETSSGLTPADWKAWEAMEGLCSDGRTRQIGISNVNLEQLVELCEGARIRPSFVQNRCFAQTRWDQEIRAFCSGNDIGYQGFSLLTANSRYFGGQVIRPENRNIPQLLLPEKPTTAGLRQDLAAVLADTGKSVSQVVFRFAQQLGMIPITGTRSESHMVSDLAIRDFNLSQKQMETLENVAFS